MLNLPSGKGIVGFPTIRLGNLKYLCNHSNPVSLLIPISSQYPSKVLY